MTLRHAAKGQFYFFQSRIGRTLSRPASKKPANRFIVFDMHTITPARSDMAVSPGRFQEQLSSLLDAGYKPLSVDELLEVLCGRTSSPPGFCITFDDGYESVFTQALPILESLSIPATVFLTTGRGIHKFS